MRVISGRNRGTKLDSLKGENTKPTSDRTKESLFNLLANMYPQGFKDITVLDLYSGSGAIGIEFASRGAKSILLCERNRQAIEYINKNLEKCRIREYTDVKVFCLDVIDCIKTLDKKVDIVFLDPPYSESKEKIQELLDNIIRCEILKDDALVILETDNEQLDIKGFNIIDKRRYGRPCLIFFKKD